MDAYAFTIPVKHRIRKAVVPVAGFGTRLYPMTRIVKKEFLPVFDADGVVKPLILKLFEELDASGIEEICVIVGGEEEIQAYRRAFVEPLPAEHVAKLPPAFADYDARIREIGRRLVFEVQKDRLGFGHAVYQSRSFCGNDPVLLLLGDTVYESHAKVPCALQLIERYEALEKPLIAIAEIPAERAASFGVLTGTWSDDSRRLLRATRFVEKPDPALARAELSMPTEGGGRAVYGVFGQYILTPEVFEALGRLIAEGATRGGEYQLTDAYAAVIDDPGLYCVVPEGRMHDLGNAEAYREALRAE